jgi:sucrose phosphorylase
MKTDINECRPMLNAYPDSIGGKLSGIVRLLQSDECRDAFSTLYLLPSMFNTDLDRGYSIIDYSLNEQYASAADLEAIRQMGIRLKLDFVLNHLSVLSPQFQDLLQHGEQSDYADFFINWNRFWQGHGTMTPEGWIQPDPELIRNMFFRKPGLPLLMVRMPDGSDIPYWNTFYQEVIWHPADAAELTSALHMQYGTALIAAERIWQALAAGKTPAEVDFTGLEKYRDACIAYLQKNRTYLGQMDLNIESPKVWEFYRSTLDAMASYGASIIRLDAFAYAPKKPGARNFMNEPETWDLLDRVNEIADSHGLTLLPEIHDAYDRKIYEKISAKGYLGYDFFLPGLMIDALENRDGARLVRWAREQKDKGIRLVTMLGCHDGIPMLDLKGLVPDAEIQKLIDLIVSRGGHVKNLHGQKNLYYQVNATFYSALGEDDRKMLLARALHLFMPGKPQVWYLDLFAGKNDEEAVRKAGPGGHKEINRTNLSQEQAQAMLQRDVVRNQIELLRFRNRFPAFSFDAEISAEVPADHQIRLEWSRQGYRAVLNANLTDDSFQIDTEDPDSRRMTVFRQK